YVGTISTQNAACPQSTSPFVISTLCAGGLGSGPLNASGGPAGIQNKKIWATNFVLTLPIVAPTWTSALNNNSTFLYMDPTSLWPTIKPNSNTAYALTAISGAWASGQCAVATSTTNLFNLQVCGTPAFSGLIFFESYGDHLALHSFPTRRSPARTST